jgi:general secretion pathway protein B
MSYILEALRKADAERERGAVPDLHAQALPLNVSSPQRLPSRQGLALWLAVGSGLAAVAGVAWYALGREPAAPAPAAVATMVPVPVPAPTAAAPRAQPATASSAEPVAAPSAPAAAASPSLSAPPGSEQPPGAVAAASPPPAVASALPAAPGADAPAAPRRRAAPAAEPAPAPGKARPPAAAGLPAKAAAAPKPSPAPRPATAEPPAPPQRLPALAELPVELRQQVPALVVGGSVYSPQASARMVVINGQVFQEGNNLAPELKLEQVRPKTAVFSIRGQRFEVPL